MFRRIKTGWNLQRLFFLVIGTLIVIQSIIEKQWLVSLAGGYFAVMGIFGTGCCGGSCKVGSLRDKTGA